MRKDDPRRARVWLGVGVLWLILGAISLARHEDGFEIGLGVFQVVLGVAFLLLWRGARRSPATAPDPGDR